MHSVTSMIQPATCTVPPRKPRPSMTHRATSQMQCITSMGPAGIAQMRSIHTPCNLQHLPACDKPRAPLPHRVHTMQQTSAHHGAITMQRAKPVPCRAPSAAGGVASMLMMRCNACLPRQAARHGSPSGGTTGRTSTTETRSHSTFRTAPTECDKSYFITAQPTPRRQDSAPRSVAAGAHPCELWAGTSITSAPSHDARTTSLGLRS